MFFRPTPAGASLGMHRMTMIPLWSPQAQFAGYYVALEKGMYAEHGIELTILPGGPGKDPAEYLKTGRADFAVMWLSSAVRHRSAGTPLKNIYQTVQRSSMMLVGRKSSGIRSVPDLAGRRIGIWGGDLALQSRALFARHGIRAREVPQSGTVNLFLRGGVDVASAMWYNEYHTIIDAGIDAGELTTFFLRDLGIDFPEDGIYALDTTIASNPAAASAFVQASAEGWEYAFRHPDEAVGIVLKHMRAAHLPANRMHQRWMLARMRELALPTNGNPAGAGMLDRAAYGFVGKTMQRYGGIAKIPTYEDFTWRGNGQK
jgi:NitT/TauT family transport system substrate-binding protein